MHRTPRIRRIIHRKRMARPHTLRQLLYRLVLLVVRRRVIGEVLESCFGGESRWYGGRVEPVEGVRDGLVDAA